MTDGDRTRPAAVGGTLAIAADVSDQDHAAELRIVIPFGVVALLLALASLAMCYGTIVLKTVFEIPKLGMNPHVQAALMSAFALGAAVAMWRDRRHHASPVPAGLGFIAALAIVLSLYVRFDVTVESIAYATLVVAALLNQIIFLHALNRTVRQQARRIEALNKNLARQVETQDHVIGRLGRLKQFLAPQIADLVVSEDRKDLLDTHRRYIACLFCDIRGFTAAAETLEPEEVIGILQAYHERIGGLVIRHQGTIGYRAGDGIMVFFNDPVPCEEPVLKAIELALDIRSEFGSIRRSGTRLGSPIGLGLGIASGYATLGMIGFQGRTDYTAIGGVVNIAARLCDKAADGQILIAQRAFQDVEQRIRVDRMGALELKGIGGGVETYDLLGLDDRMLRQQPET